MNIFPAHMKKLKSKGKRLALAISLAFLSSSAFADDVRDPFEGFNRAIYNFNVALDNAIIKPVAKGYDAALPQPIQDCIGGFFGNIADIWTGINNVLQAKVDDAVSDAGRVIVNTTAGMLGCFDVASRVGLTKHKADFGQTLGHWGVASGPYLVLPFFGPSSVRDAAGLVVDIQADLITDIDHIPTRNQLMVTRTISQRASLLYVSDIIDNAALDPYLFVRDAYFQRRSNQIDDGDSPAESQENSNNSDSGGVVNTPDNIPQNIPAQ